MKPIYTAKDIVPLADFKACTSELLRKFRENQRPLVITQNGRPVAVVISPEEFDWIRERDCFSKAVSEDRTDSAAGRLIDDEALEAELEKEFGPLK